MKVALIALFALVGLCANAEDVATKCYVRNSNDTVRLYPSGNLYSRQGNCWANHGNQGAGSYQAVRAAVTAPATSYAGPNSYSNTNSAGNSYSTVHSGGNSYSSTYSGGNSYSTTSGPGNAYATFRNQGSTHITIQGGGPATVRYSR